MSNEILQPQSGENIEIVIMTRAQFEGLRRYPENYIYFVYEERVVANEPVAHYSLYKGDTPVVFGDVDRILPAYMDIARPGNYRVAAFCLSATRPEEPDADAFPSLEDLEKNTQGWLARPTDADVTDKVWWVSFRWYNGKTNLVIEDDTWTIPVQVSGWQGPQGDQGNPGETGKDGFGVYFCRTEYGTDKNVLIALSDINNLGRDLQVGDYIIEASEDKNLYQITELSGNNVSCEYLGSLKGAQGDMGAIGPNGLNFYIIDHEVSTDTLTNVYASDYFPSYQRNNLEAGESFLTKDFNLYEITQVSVDGLSSRYIFSATKKGNIKGERGEKGDKGDRGEKGEKGDTGDPFMVSKTYPSVEAMNAGYATDGVPLYGMVLIDTGNVEDEDNAKLYIKGDTAYTFLTDLSGAQGIKGNTGYSFRKGEVSSVTEDGTAVFTTITPSQGLQAGDIIVGFSGTLGLYGQLYRITDAAALTGTDLGVSIRGPQGVPGVQGESGFGMYRTARSMTDTDSDYFLQKSEVVTLGRALQVGDFIIEGSENSYLWRVKDAEGEIFVRCGYICSLRGPQGENATTTETATAEKNGLMAAGDKERLDNLSLDNIEGVVPFNKGGTGKTTGESAAVNLLFNLNVDYNTPIDDNFIVTSGVSNPHYFYKKKFSYIWDWIKSKLATVATTGSYNDLTDKPAIPSVGNGTITITQGGTAKGSFTTNQSGDQTIALDAGGGSVTIDKELSFSSTNPVENRVITTNMRNNAGIIPIIAANSINFPVISGFAGGIGDAVMKKYIGLNTRVNILTLTSVKTACCVDALMSASITSSIILINNSEVGQLVKNTANALSLVRIHDIYMNDGNPVIGQSNHNIIIECVYNCKYSGRNQVNPSASPMAITDNIVAADSLDTVRKVADTAEEEPYYKDVQVACISIPTYDNTEA